MSLEVYLDRAVKLAPAMALVPRILELLRRPDSSLDELIELVRVDPPLTAQILKVSNSAHFGSTVRVYEVSEAINRIGFAETYRLVGRLMSKEFLNQRMAAYYAEDSELWENSLLTAAMCELMGARVGVDKHLAYTAGLLHSIGKYVLGAYAGKKYHALYRRIQAEGLSLLNAEQEVFGIDHAEVGARLMERWKFSREVTMPVRYQYTPSRASGFKRTAALLHLANWAVGALGANHGRAAHAMRMEPVALELAGLTQQDVIAWVVDGQSLLADTRAEMGPIEAATTSAPA